MGQRQIPTDAELNAVVKSDVAFPFLLSVDDLAEYHKGFVNWHKQPAVEISVVCEGAVNVNVLESERTVAAGGGFIIMPGFLHSIRPAGERIAAKYFTLIFRPELLYGFRDSFFDTAYYRPMAGENTPCYFFGGEEWVGDLEEKLVWIKERYDDTPQTRLDVQRCLQDAWVILAERLTGGSRQASSTHDTKKIFDLVGYLHEHYAEKFSLSDMAKGVSMSRNECCRYFRKMMNMTITEYLTEYRLSLAISLLKTSDLSVTEISERTGFCDVSYFIKIFRLKTGTTPKRYLRDSQKRE